MWVTHLCLSPTLEPWEDFWFASQGYPGLRPLPVTSYLTAVRNTPPALAFGLHGLTQAVDAFTFTEGCMEVAKVASASSCFCSWWRHVAQMPPLSQPHSPISSYRITVPRLAFSSREKRGRAEALGNRLPNTWSTQGSPWEEYVGWAGESRGGPLASLHRAHLSRVNGEHRPAWNGEGASPHVPGHAFTFGGLSESDGFAGEPVTSTRTLMLSAFCFFLYIREAGHKSEVPPP